MADLKRFHDGPQIVIYIIGPEMFYIGSKRSTMGSNIAHIWSLNCSRLVSKLFVIWSQTYLFVLGPNFFHVGSQFFSLMTKTSFVVNG